MKPIETIDKCITCSICTVNCPVAEATQKFKGPKLTGPSAERFRLLNHKEIEGLEYCSNCKACDTVCPSGVQISSLNMLARAEYSLTHRPRLRDWILSHAPLLAKLTTFVPYKLQSMAVNNPITRWILDKIGIDARAYIPLFAPTPFAKLLKKYKQKRTKQQKKELTKQVVFFPGCYINYYEPQTGIDLVIILEKAGYDVLLPKFKCCNLPLVSNGFYNDAKKAAQHNSDHLETYTQKKLPILTMCPSCALTLKQDYAEMFPYLIEKTKIFSSNIEDACEFIIDLIEKKELHITLQPSSTKLLYHTACHLKNQGIGRPGLELIQRIPNVDIEDAQAGCCGISGSYGFKKNKYDIATTIGSKLFDAIKKSGATYTLSECGTCRLQMKHHTGVESLHPLTWLRKVVTNS